MANYYFSGQGIVYVAERDESVTPARPENFIDLCNVPSLEISIDITKFEHKEAKTGQRAIDLTIVQEKNGTFTMILENINSHNLALAMWGTSSTIAAASIASEIVPIFDCTDGAVVGARHALDNMNVDPAGTNTVALAVTPTTWVTLTAYALGDTVIPTVPNGFFYKAIVAGTSDVGEPVFPTGIGDTVVDATVTWQNQGKTAFVEGTDFDIDDPWGTLILRGNPVLGGNDLDVAYEHLGYVNTDALTVLSQERYLRFEGLNTVDGLPVLVEIYKASFDPLTGFALINEEIAQITLNGNMLIDEGRPTGDQFFRWRQVGDVDNCSSV